MVTLLPQTSVALLKAHLQQHVLEVATLRLALDIQSHRIVQTIPDFVWPDHLQTQPEIRLHTPARH